MAFFRKWKTHYKHKKFTSDEAVDAEDWGLDKPMKDNSKLNIENMKLDSVAIVDKNDEEEDNMSIKLFATYDLRYLGCTPIETKRSEKITSEAIKTVIANSKAGGRKSKSQKRVNLNIAQEGIEVLDFNTHETLMRFSIYEISCCSVDGAHDHAFSFVGSEKDPLSDVEKMSCHVFLCAKRKIAHEITLMAARCFENAYQQWRDTLVQHGKGQGIQFADNVDAKKVLKEQNGSGYGVIESRAEVHHYNNFQQPPQQQQKQQQPLSQLEDSKTNQLLIDLAAADNDACSFAFAPHNTWVSFEDEVRESARMVAC